MAKQGHAEPHMGLDVFSNLSQPIFGVGGSGETTKTKGALLYCTRLCFTILYHGPYAMQIDHLGLAKMTMRLT